MRQTCFDFFYRIPAPTFKNFIVKRENQELFAYLNKITTEQHDQLPTTAATYLFGDQDSGKSHLLKAIANHPIRQESALFIDGTTQSPSQALTPNAVEKHALFIVDAIDLCTDKDQTALFNLANLCQYNHKKLLLSGRAHPNQLGMRPELQTRLYQGMVYYVTALDDPGKLQALTCYAAEANISIDRDILEFILNRVERNLSTVIDLLCQIDCAAMEQARSITVPFVRTLLFQRNFLY